MNDGERSLARGGPGAVMGSKNLKAIVVEGDQKMTVVDQELFKFVMYEMTQAHQASPLTSQALPEFGTVVMMNIVNSIGALPTRNFRTGQFEGAEPDQWRDPHRNPAGKKSSCWACPIGCTRITHTENGEGEGPEYETTWAFGAECGIDDLAAIIEANDLCNELGLDTISAGLDHRLRHGAVRVGHHQQ